MTFSLMASQILFETKRGVTVRALEQMALPLLRLPSGKFVWMIFPDVIQNAPLTDADTLSRSAGKSLATSFPSTSLSDTIKFKKFEVVL